MKVQCDLAITIRDRLIAPISYKIALPLCFSLCFLPLTISVHITQNITQCLALLVSSPPAPLSAVLSPLSRSARTAAWPPAAAAAATAASWPGPRTRAASSHLAVFCSRPSSGMLRLPSAPPTHGVSTVSGMYSIYIVDSFVLTQPGPTTVTAPTSPTATRLVNTTTSALSSRPPARPTPSAT